METVRQEPETAIGKFQDGDLNLKVMRRHIHDYLKTNIDCAEVRAYIEEVKNDDELLANYIQGRKYKPDIAFDTLRRYAESRFKHYPDVFQHVHDYPDRLRPLIELHCLGVLKNTDKFGRRIVFCDMSKWDPAVYSPKDITIAAVYGAEKFWRQPEVVENGIVLLQNTQGFGFALARQHSISHVRMMVNIFLYSFPMAIKRFYYLNLSYLFRLLARMTMPLISKKIISRLSMFDKNEIPDELYEIASPDILPTWAGGKLSIEEAAEDISFYESDEERIIIQDSGADELTSHHQNHT